MIHNLDIAHTLGHKSAEHMYRAHKICKEAYNLNSAKIRWSKALVVGTQLDYMRKYELEECIEAIILFQAMMEAVINHELDTNSKLSTLTKKQKASFAGKWENSFNILSAFTDGKESLGKYLEFYKNYRIPVVHPKSRKKLENVENFRFPNIHEGIKNGWLAFAELSEKLGTPHNKDSWTVFCGMHKLPAKINESNFPDIDMLARAMSKKHIDGLKSAQEK